MLRHVGFALAALATLMASIDGTIIVVALPQLTDSLQTSLSWVGWTLTSYQLVQIVMYPLAGQLSDMFGRSRVFLFCVITFTVASLLCGIAPNVFFLIAFRALQAIGGGGIMPSVIGLIADEYKRHRAQAIGLISSIMPIGSIIGPNLGGFLLENWSWRALFFINVPIGIILVVGFVFLMPKSQENQARAKLHIDAIGLVQFIGAILSLMYGMTLIADNPALASSPLIWILFVVSGVLALAFVRHVRSTPDAIMEYRLLARRPFLAANVYNFLFGAVTMGFYSFIPYYAVVKYGLTPFESAAVLTPRAVVVIAISFVASMFVKRLGYRLPMLLGMAFVGVNFIMMAQGWSSVSLGGLSIGGFWLLASMIAVGGVGMGIASPASSNVAIDQAPDKAASITGIRGTFRLAGGTISITCVVLALSFFSDQAEGLDTIFKVFTAVLVVTAPLVLMIPEAGHVLAPARRPQSLPGAAAAAAAQPRTQSSWITRSAQPNAGLSSGRSLRR
jgi:EmrB/QacA subfamily drug resistance transporter